MKVSLELIADSSNSSESSVELFGNQNTISIVLKNPDRRIELKTIDLLRAVSFLGQTFLALDEPRKI